ncbi:hypothetical protein BDR03DRAFT_1007472 [Suillus americanus]|nr:hypothetical protein BDR03DRAFT_1007472 [Suillus americanus]
MQHSTGSFSHPCHLDLAAKVDIGALPYTTGAAYHIMPLEEIHVTEVSDWVNDKNSLAIYLLIGPLGSETSAVAHEHVKDSPPIFFSMIARDLAEHDPDFMAYLGDKMKRQAAGSSPHIPTQFSFILAPAQQLTSLGPEQFL